MRRFIIPSLAALMAAISPVAIAQQDETSSYHEVYPENLLIMTLESGEVVVAHRLRVGCGRRAVRVEQDEVARALEVDPRRVVLRREHEHPRLARAAEARERVHRRR